MMRTVLRLLSSVPLMLVAGTALAVPVTCPLMLGDGDVQVARAPAGWTPVPSQGARLSSGGLIRGRPEEWGYLRPDQTKTTRDGGWSTNGFSPGEERWLWCGYGGQGVLKIAKRLPDGATVCTVTHKSTKRDGITEISATCR